MHFTKDDEQEINSPLQLDEHLIRLAEHVRILGVHLEPCVTCEHHLRRTEATKTKQLNGLQALCGFKWVFSLSDVIKPYLGPVIPAMLLESSIWYMPHAGNGAHS